MDMDDTYCEYAVQKLFYACHSHLMSANILITGLRMCITLVEHLPLRS